MGCVTLFLRPDRPFYISHKYTYMSLTQKDLQLIKDMMETMFDVRFKAQDEKNEKRMAVLFAQQAQDIKRDIRDEMDSRFIAFERRMTKIFDEKLFGLERRMEHGFSQIREDIGDIVTNTLMPKIIRLEEKIF